MAIQGGWQAEDDLTPAGRAIIEGQDTQDRVAQTTQAFYQENFALVYRFVYRHIGSREEAEDISSDVFLKAMRGIDSRRSPESMCKWVFQIARTTLADYWRAHSRKGGSTLSLEELVRADWEIPAGEGEPEDSGRSAERVRGILLALLPSYRDVLTCRFLLYLSAEETATRTGRSETSIRVMQFRALKAAAHASRARGSDDGGDPVVSL